MSEATRPDVHLRTLVDLVAWFRAEKVRGVVIGGVAASLLGRPRVTRDVDCLVLIPEAHWSSFVASGAKYGFRPRVPDVLGFAHEARVLLMKHEPSGVDVDISLGALPFEEQAVMRQVIVKAGRVAIPVVAPEDLIIMKAVAGRDRDIMDIEGVLDVHRKLDLRRIRRWLREFSEVLETPEKVSKLEDLLAQRRKQSRRRKN